MCPNARSRVSAVAVSLALSLWLAPRVEAVDGVVLIDQNRALAGNVTPGDFPGFPVTISRPGSYRLSGNLEVTDPDITAIEITADHVTLDLNGFSIQGPLDRCSGFLKPAWCSSASLRGSGIEAHTAGSTEPDHSNVAVLNGTVRAMGHFGVSLGQLSRIDKVSVLDNGSFGIHIGNGALVSSSVAQGNNALGNNSGDVVIGTGRRVNNICGLDPC